MSQEKLCGYHMAILNRFGSEAAYSPFECELCLIEACSTSILDDTLYTHMFENDEMWFMFTGKRGMPVPDASLLDC